MPSLPPRPQEKQKQNTKRFRILVADSDPFISRIIEASLEHLGDFEVHPLARGSLGLQQVVETPPDLILWDILLPDTNTLLPSLVALCPHASLALMVPEDRASLWEGLKRLGLSGVLIKPFTLDALHQLVEGIRLGSLFAQQMPQVQLFFVGQQLTLCTPSGFCQTRILQVEQDAFWVTGAPPISLPQEMDVGTALLVEISGETALYRFRTRALEKTFRLVETWKLAMPRTISRTQRRRYLRVPLKAEVRIQPQPTQEELRAVLTNLGGGGCALISPVPLSSGQAVRIVVENNASQNLNLRGAVVRCTPQPFQPNHFAVAVAFTHLSPQTKQALKQLLQQKIEEK